MNQAADLVFFILIDLLIREKMLDPSLLLFCGLPFTLGTALNSLGAVVDVAAVVEGDMTVLGSEV